MWILRGIIKFHLNFFIEFDTNFYWLLNCAFGFSSSLLLLEIFIRDKVGYECRFVCM